MAKKKPQTIPEEDSFKITPGQNSPDKAHKELSEHDVFAGDEEFYDFMARQEQDTTKQAGRKINLSKISSIFKHLSTLQKALGIGIIVMAAILLYALLKPTSKFAGNIPSAAIARQTTTHKPPATRDSGQLPARQLQNPQFASSSKQPLSLQVAQDFYSQKDYAMAYEIYNQMRQGLVMSEEGELIDDFLQLKMALCIKKTGDIDQANHLLRIVSESRSPILRVLANYYLSFSEFQKGQYLKARTRAYQTIALVSAVDMDRDLALLLQRDCHLVIAESVTRYIISLRDVDKDIPSRLWSSPAEVDPFSGIDEISTLSVLLNSGSEQLSKGLLSPQIQKITYPGAPVRWFVACYGASIEELLARLATNAQLDVIWAFDKEAEPEGIQNAIRNRPVSIYLPAATTQQSVTTAAGCAGLLARTDEQGLVNIFNPDEYGSLSEFVSLLTQEAVSLWQSFSLSFYDDTCVPNAHFALGLLQAQRGLFTESIAEYKMVANRYSRTYLAPYALLHSSKLKANLHDHLGARQDLKQLVEQYPDSELSGWACLYLADVTKKARLMAEAARLYGKVYNLGLSQQSQAEAAFGAAECFYEIEDYETAAKWLIRCIDVVTDQTDRKLYLAYFQLGKINLTLGNLQQACDAFQYALAGNLSRENYIEAVSALVEAQIRQEHFIEALNLIDSTHPWQFSQEESIELLRTKSKVLRTMGLADKAISVLGDRAEYVPDPQLKAKLRLELAKCYIAKGDLKFARRDLTETLVLVEPGPLAQEVALELADVCLKLGENSQAINVCSQLLDSGPSEQIRQKALSTLATAYKQQKNFDKAALVLLGRWNVVENTNEKITTDDSGTSGQLQKRTQ